jgi:hypothetical protein
MTTFYYDDKRNMNANKIVNGALQATSNVKVLPAKIFYIITSNELEKLFKKHYNIDCEIAPEFELHNGYTPLFELKPEKYEPSDKDYRSLYNMVEGLIYKGALTPGNFLIDHSW